MEWKSSRRQECRYKQAAKKLGATGAAYLGISGQSAIIKYIWGWSEDYNKHIGRFGSTRTSSLGERGVRELQHPGRDLIDSR